MSDAVQTTTRSRWPLLAFLATVVALAVAGGVVAAGTLTRGHDDDGAAAVAVLDVKKVNGLAPQALAGMTHFPSYVSPDKMRVQVAVELRNRHGDPLTYAPGQFRLRVGHHGAAVRVVGSTLDHGTLAPNASIDGTLSFVARRTKRHTDKLWLEYRESESAAPVRIDLGSSFTRGAIPPTTSQHAHPAQARAP